MEYRGNMLLRLECCIKHLLWLLTAVVSLLAAVSLDPASITSLRSELFK